MKITRFEPLNVAVAESGARLQPAPRLRQAGLVSRKKLLQCLCAARGDARPTGHGLATVHGKMVLAPWFDPRGSSALSDDILSWIIADFSTSLPQQQSRAQHTWIFKNANVRRLAWTCPAAAIGWDGSPQCQVIFKVDGDFDKVSDEVSDEVFKVGLKMSKLQAEARGGTPNFTVQSLSTASP